MCKIVTISVQQKQQLTERSIEFTIFTTTTKAKRSKMQNETKWNNCRSMSYCRTHKQRKWVEDERFPQFPNQVTYISSCQQQTATAVSVSRRYKMHFIKCRAHFVLFAKPKTVGRTSHAISTHRKQTICVCACKNQPKWNWRRNSKTKYWIFWSHFCLIFAWMNSSISRGSFFRWNFHAKKFIEQFTNEIDPRRTRNRFGFIWHEQNAHEKFIYIFRIQNARTFCTWKWSQCDATRLTGKQCKLINEHELVFASLSLSVTVYVHVHSMCLEIRSFLVRRKFSVSRHDFD